MANRFLAWYNRELEALRKRAGAFASKHPKIAARLRMTADAADDPHVERIIQSFAYTAARIRQKLDDDFPELTEGLLDVLYPHYLAQIPSMTVMKFNPTRELDSVVSLPTGFFVETEPLRGDVCRFVTTQAVTLAPLEVGDCKLLAPPFAAPPFERAGIVASGCLAVSLNLSPILQQKGKLALDSVSFFVKAPLATAAAIYELVLNQTLGVAAARHEDDPAAHFLGPRQIRPLGFDAKAAMLPQGNRSFPGFRLLTEFFALPEKFLFFEVSGLKPFLTAFHGQTFHLYFYLAAAPAALIKAVNASTLDIHCSPAINLFPQRAEPIFLNHTRHEYEVTADSRRNSSREIHTITRVALSNSSGESYEAMPFFGRSGKTSEQTAACFWQHKRVYDPDSDSFLSRLALVDYSLCAASVDDDAILSVDTLCINRGLPEALPFGGGQPYIRPMNQRGGLATIECLLPPSATRRFSSSDESMWRLMSHLTLNHLPITGNESQALKDMLRLYDFRRSPESEALIEAIVSVAGEKSTARLSDGTVARGVDIVVEFNDAVVDRGMAYLFGDVLSHFFGLYASINTFSRLTVRLSGVALPVVKFPPRTAEDILL